MVSVFTFCEFIKIEFFAVHSQQMQDAPELNIARQQRRGIFLTVAAGVFMSTMDSSQVNVALPVLMRSLDSSLAVTQWVVQAYLLTVTVLLVFWGRLCGRWGCGPVYSCGLLIFTGGSLLCGAAPSVWFLIGCRFIQALGASMMMAAGPALIRSVFPAEQLGRGLGLIGIATSLGLMTGPVLSGLLLRWVHWRAIFWVTVPVGLAFFLYSRGNLSSCPGRRRISEQEGNKVFDLAGALLWACAVVLTILLATHAAWLASNRDGVASGLFWSGAVVMPGCWLLFFWREARAAHPILPLSLFRHRFFAAAIASSALSFAVLFVVLILVPFYLDKILHLPPDRIGYVMMSLPLTVFLVSPSAGRLHDWIGARIVSTAGLLCCLIGILLLGSLTADTSTLFVAGCLSLMGFGQAMFLAPNSASALAGVPEEEAGLTASLLATARNFGMLAGTALAGLSFALHFAAATGGLDMRDFVPAAEPAFMAALRTTFFYGAVLALAAMVISLLRGGRAAKIASGR
jgi:EmrB/QacA subfamily drug resistance transporter